MGDLQAAIAHGRDLGKLALYFGCWERAGHYLHLPGGHTLWDKPKDLPWRDEHLDGGLLKNGKRPDVYDGKVVWTCGGKALWYAFFWWDNSVDRRGASNSGFYVRGFGWPEPQEAFDYACAAFPTVVARQKRPLVLQNPHPPAESSASGPTGSGANTAADGLVRDEHPPTAEGEG